VICCAKTNEIGRLGKQRLPDIKVVAALRYRPKQFKGPYLMHTRHVQESLANAKVSARQQRVYEGRPLAKKSTAIRQINARNKVEKYIQWVSTLSLTIWVYLHFV